MENLYMVENIKYKSNLEKMKYLKGKADDFNLEYNENIKNFKFSDKNIEYMIKNIASLEYKLENMIQNYK